MHQTWKWLIGAEHLSNIDCLELIAISCFHYRRLVKCLALHPEHLAIKAVHLTSIHFKYCVHLLMTAAGPVSSMSVFIVAAVAAAKRCLSDLPQFQGRTAFAAMHPKAFTAGCAIPNLHQIS